MAKLQIELTYRSTSVSKYLIPKEQPRTTTTHSMHMYQLGVSTEICQTALESNGSHGKLRMSEYGHVTYYTQ